MGTGCGGVGDEQFCLKWNDYHESIVATLGDLRDEEEFVDVTLVCGSEHIRAHRLVLSACSDFFRSLFKRSTSSPAAAAAATNPFVVLWDISPADLRHILHFMYNGEVEVKQAHLNTFLAVAERLRVRGLCQSGGKSSPAPPPSRSPPPPPPSNSHRSQTPPPTSSTSGGNGSKQSSNSARRSSLDHGSMQPHKRPKTESNSSPPPGPSREGGAGDAIGESGGSQDEGSLMSRSGAGSEADYGEFGFGTGGDDGPGGFGADAGAMAGALMGTEYMNLGKQRETFLITSIYFCPFFRHGEYVATRNVGPRSGKR